MSTTNAYVLGLGWEYDMYTEIHKNVQEKMPPMPVIKEASQAIEVLSNPSTKLIVAVAPDVAREPCANHCLGCSFSMPVARSLFVGSLHPT